MKVVNIIGGLGNQMFQYAFALSLVKKFPKEDVYIDIHHFHSYQLHNGFELKSIFRNIDLPIATPDLVKAVSRYIPHYKLSRLVRKLFPNLKSEYIESCNYLSSNEPFLQEYDCYYEGYWQAFPYYKDLQDEIIHAFEFPQPNDYNVKLEANIVSSQSVGIHIRRGDYLKEKAFKGICELDYYRKAIERLMESDNSLMNFYIFSNDIEWCKKYIQPLVGENKIEYVTGNRGKESYWDMYLMSKCKNLIIANSSFSWWGAFLNKNVDKVYAPSIWVNRNQNMEIHNPKWILI